MHHMRHVAPKDGGADENFSLAMQPPCSLLKMRRVVQWRSWTKQRYLVMATAASLEVKLYAGADNCVRVDDVSVVRVQAAGACQDVRAIDLAGSESGAVRPASNFDLPTSTLTNQALGWLADVLVGWRAGWLTCLAGWPQGAVVSASSSNGAHLPERCSPPPRSYCTLTPYGGLYGGGV
jgi:hypothetical protein